MRRLNYLAAVLIGLAGGVVAPTSAPAAPLPVINGSGSSWAAPAIDQWSQDVRDKGIVVNYTPNGSQAGRSDFASNLSDFAGSDIAFLNGQDKVAGGVVERPPYGYSYIPITAGGTAFMYHLTVGGKQVTNLRLSGDTITKIFTGKITDWSNPQITKEYGAQLPSKPIVPVVRSDGSGATAQFTAWMNIQYGNQWSAFCAQYAHVTARPCGATEFYPAFGRSKGQNSSTAAANYVVSSAGEGSINYDEYSYALQSGFPVVKLLNPAGFYVLPTASNDAVALTRAKIDTDPKSLTYLMQKLEGVYTNPDPRSYPLSSYSYLIVPRSGRGGRPPGFTDDKGRTLSTFVNYFLCAGQREMAPLGYSPLPINLVRGGLDQTDKISGAVPTPNRATLAGCGNPTFIHGVNTLLRNAPQPPACDKVGSPLSGCGAGVRSHRSNANPLATSSATAGPVSSRSTGVNRPAAAAPSASHKQQLDPVTGQVTAIGDQPNAGGVSAQAVLVSGRRNNAYLYPALTTVALIAAVIIPPFLSLWIARRRRRPGIPHDRLH